MWDQNGRVPWTDGLFFEPAPGHDSSDERILEDGGYKVFEAEVRRAGIDESKTIVLKRGGKWVGGKILRPECQRCERGADIVRVNFAIAIAASGGT